MFDESLYKKHIDNNEYACFWCDVLGCHGLMSQQEDCNKRRKEFHKNKHPSNINELEIL